MLCIFGVGEKMTEYLNNEIVKVVKIPTGPSCGGGRNRCQFYQESFNSCKLSGEKLGYDNRHKMVPKCDRCMSEKWGSVLVTGRVDDEIDEYLRVRARDESEKESEQE